MFSKIKVSNCSSIKKWEAPVPRQMTSFKPVALSTFTRQASTSFSPRVAAVGSGSNSKLWMAAAAVAMGGFAYYNRDELQEKFMPVAYAADKTPIYGIPGTNKERSFIALKPDAVHRGFIGEVIARFEAKGYKLVAIKVIVPSKDFAEKHYSDLAKKPFFPSLVSYFTSGPVVAMIWEGKDVITGGRSLIGATNPQQATPGTIRGDYAVAIGRNLIHGSDSVESAKHEITLWFNEKEVADYDHALDKWINETK